jgi:hypothetical protein
MYIYWPVVLIGLSVFIIFLPAPVLYHQSRKWWAATNVSSYLSRRQFDSATNEFSGACGALGCTGRSSFVTSSWAICIALTPTPWG